MVQNSDLEIEDRPGHSNCYPDENSSLKSNITSPGGTLYLTFLFFFWIVNSFSKVLSRIFIIILIARFPVEN